MNKIIEKKQLSERVFLIELEAPLIAKSRKAGNFIIVRVGKNGERVPLTIVEANTHKGTITIIVQNVGLSSKKLCNLEIGDYITDVVGPLGNPTHITNFGTVVCAGGGVGAAPLLPIVEALKKKGNRIISIIAGRTKESIILEEKIRQASDVLHIMTDDGSYGEQGVITKGLEKFIQIEHVDKIFAIGPAIMMKYCSLLAKKHNIPIDVSLNTIMVDGTGMCGACRLTIGGKTKFVCIDGPEFNGNQVDWSEMLNRLDTFKKIENADLQNYESHLDKQEVTEVKETDFQHFFVQTKENFEELTNREADWRKKIRKDINPRDRLKIDRVQMPELTPTERLTNRLKEVNQGLTQNMALNEAKRCLDCAKPSCIEGCPVNINIPSFIKNIERNNFSSALDIIKETSTLPAVCGRVCPQEKQCESKCIYGKMGKKPVAIGYLERFVADYVREKHIKPKLSQKKSFNGIKIAVIGSGPAGLSFSGEMAKKGYDVYVYEALHEIGGVLKYGIPEFRLPSKIVETEIDNLKELGVHFVTDCIIGRTITIEELQKKGFKGFFIASGAGLPKLMNIPGENLINVMSSNEYLTRINLMDAANPLTDTPINIGKKVVVVGGGNTAMDSSRTARRLGADVTLVYRRSEKEMPARLEEIKHAKEEGVRFLTLHNPLEYIADEHGCVKAVLLQEMQLGEPDTTGRRRPEPINGKTKFIDVDQVIVAVGVSPNPIVQKSTKGLKITSKNTIVVDENMQTSLSNIYAGGDIVRGGATVILAMGDGRKAAEQMHNQLSLSI